MSGPTVSAELTTRVRAWRRDLHQIPETAFDEHKTGARLAKVLHELGYEVTTGIGGTGLVGSLTRGTSGRAVGFRSELDALPILEESGVEYASRIDGRMHACGHDGHMAMLLGAAAPLAAHDEARRRPQRRPGPHRRALLHPVPHRRRPQRDP